MHVHRVLIDGDDFLSYVAEQLATVDRAAAEKGVITTAGWDLAKLAASAPPADAADMALAFRYAHLAAVQRVLAANSPDDAQVRAAIHYPRGGGMWWHTNGSRGGWRVYVPRLFDEGDSGLLTSGGFVRDVAGYANLFLIDDTADSRHAVVARSPRMSAGFWLPPDSPRAKRWIAI